MPSAARRARAPMVEVGLTPAPVVKELPSTMNRLGTSWARFQPSTTAQGLAGGQLEECATGEHCHGGPTPVPAGVQRRCWATEQSERRLTTLRMSCRATSLAGKPPLGRSAGAAKRTNLGLPTERTRRPASCACWAARAASFCSRRCTRQPAPTPYNARDWVGPGSSPLRSPLRHRVLQHSVVHLAQRTDVNRLLIVDRNTERGEHRIVQR